MRALILVDIQKDFCPGGSLAVAEGDAVVPVANRLMGEADLVVATQDWHPPGHGSFASQHEGKAPFEMGELAGVDQVLWPDHCVQGTEGAAFHPDLDMRPVEAIFRKGMDPEIDSYSGFYDNGHRRSTGLASYLKGKGVEEVWLVGIATDVCVLFTGLDAVAEGFRCVVIEDGCRGVEQNEGDCARALEKLQEAGATVRTSAEVAA